MSCGFYSLRFMDQLANYIVYAFSDCLNSQNDVANNVFTPAAALSTDIGLCRIDESNEGVGILMVRNNGVWGSVGVSHFPMLLYDIQVE